MHDLTGVFLPPLTSNAPPENMWTRSINPPVSSIPALFLYSSYAPLETSTSVHWFLEQLLLGFYSFSRHLECWDIRRTFCSPFLFSASWPEFSQSLPCRWFTCIKPNLKWFSALWSHLNYSVLNGCRLCCLSGGEVYYTSFTQV